MLWLWAALLCAACEPLQLTVPVGDMQEPVAQPLESAVPQAPAAPLEIAVSASSDECLPGAQAAIIGVNRLNVRATPSLEATVLYIALKEETYPVLGQSADGEWIQIQTLGSEEREAWVFGALVQLQCLEFAPKTVPVRTMAQLWSQGAILSGSGYVRQPSPVYASPDSRAAIVGMAETDSLLAVSRIVENAQGERWALLQAPDAETGPQWIPARSVMALPDTLLALTESDTVELGQRIRIVDAMQTLERLKVFPASDGGLPYTRATYMAPDTGPREDCDARCALLQAAQREDGSWFLPYEDRFTYDPAALQVEHLVPLYEAHISEGWLWDGNRRLRYGRGQDATGTLVILSRKMRQQRGTADPSRWLPAAHRSRCRYVVDWISVKSYWGLTADTAEKQVLADVLDTCDDDRLLSPELNQLSLHTADPEGDPWQLAVDIQCAARDEIVTITNTGAHAVNLQDWHLHDKDNKHRFRLPRWLLAAGEQVTLASGPATGDIYLTAALVWNNNGDTVYLYDSAYTLVAVQACF